MVTRNQNLDQRMNWFDRQFLRAQDFADESDYQVDRLRRHLRTLHTPGVAEGLVVRGQPGDSSVTVDPGTAIDDQGREIVLITQSPPQNLPSAATTAELYMSYTEAQTGPSQDPGITGYTRITEIPQFTVRQTAPATQPVPASGVLLATLSLNGGQLASAPDISGQIKAGATVGDVTAFSVTLKRVGQPSSAWPRLTASGPNQVSLAGDLRLNSQGAATGALGLPGPLTLNDVMLTAPGQSQLTVAGDLQLSSQGSATGRMTVPGLLNLGSGLRFGSDSPITAISRDPALSAARDSAVPTEAAVKSYADAIRTYVQKIINIQTGSVLFDGSGRGSFTQDVTFATPYAAQPQVLLYFTYYDLQVPRWNLDYYNLSGSGFTLRIQTQNDSYLYRVVVGWMTFGQLP